MKGKRYSEEQIDRILKEVEKGKPVADVCREHGVSEQSVYRWRTKFAGIDASDVKSAPFTWLAIVRKSQNPRNSFISTNVKRIRLEEWSENVRDEALATFLYGLQTVLNRS